MSARGNLPPSAGFPGMSATGKTWAATLSRRRRSDQLRTLNSFFTLVTPGADQAVRCA